MCRTTPFRPDELRYPTSKEEPMRIYYVMEAQGRRCHVRTALGVDDRA